MTSSSPEQPPSVGTERRRSTAWVAKQIKKGRRDRVLAALEDWPAVELVELLLDLPLSRARDLYRWLPNRLAVKVMAELDPQVGAVLAAEESIDRLARIVAGLDLDEGLDLLHQLPDSTQQEVVDRLPPESPLVRQMAYGEDTVGEIMSHRFVVVPKTWTLAATVATMQAKSDTIGSIDAVYVVDEAGRLAGYLTLQDLLLHPGTDEVDRWLHPDTVTVRPEADREDALQLAIARNADTVPVVNAQGVLLGAITADELAMIVRDEAREDANIAAGLSRESGPGDSVGQMVRHRLPWLLAGLLGSTLAGLAVGSFEEALLEAAILASFIPVVMAMAGNAGIQASTVTVQGISLGSIWAGDQWARFGREVSAALLNAAVVGSVLALFIMLASSVTDIENPASLAVTALLALVISMTVAVALGATIPIALDRLGVDPAVSTGVFIVAVNDIVSVSVFFFMATALYL